MQSMILDNLPVPAKPSNQQITNLQEFSEMRKTQLSSGSKDSFLPNQVELPWQKITTQASIVEDTTPPKEVYLKEMVEIKNTTPIEGFVSLTMLTEEEKIDKKETIPPLHGIESPSAEKEATSMTPLNATTKIYVGSLTLVGLYIMYRAVKKTI